MAKALARAGCAVSIWGRNPEKNRAAIAELAPCGAPVEARICETDLSDFIGSHDLHRTTKALDDAAFRLSRYFLALTGINASLIPAARLRQMCRPPDQTFMQVEVHEPAPGPACWRPGRR